jgi:hypothetical protein
VRQIFDSYLLASESSVIESQVRYKRFKPAASSSPSVPAVTDEADDLSSDVDNDDVGGNTDDSTATSE